MDYHDRTPDIETEKSKYWFPNQLEEKNLPDKSKGINYTMKNGQTIIFFPTFIIRDKNKKIVFAIKIKHEDKFILYGIWQKKANAEKIEISLQKMLNETGKHDWGIKNLVDYEDDWIKQLENYESGNI